MRLDKRKKQINYKYPTRILKNKDRCLVTICIGHKEKLRYYYDFNRETMVNYCERYDLDFIELKDDFYDDFSVKKHKYTPSHLNKSIITKYQLPNICEKYKQILYLDADVFISPIAKNVFEYVPIDMLGVCKCQFKRRTSRLEKRDIDNLVNEFGYVKMSELSSKKLPYWNAGVMVLSSHHNYIFDNLYVLNSVPLVFLEQSLLVYNSFKYFDKIKYIPIDFNYPVYDKSNFNIDIDTNKSFYHTVGSMPKHEKSSYVYNCFKKKECKITQNDIFKKETYYNKNRILIVGLQSSGSSFFTHCLSSFLSNHYTILDLFAKNDMTYIYNALDKLCNNSSYIIKITLTTLNDMNNIINIYKPDHKILICRDIKEVCESLSSKPYRNNVVDLNIKIKTYNNILKHKKYLFNEIYNYNDFKSIIATTSIEDILMYSLRDPIIKNLFLNNCCGVGNNYGIDHNKYFSKEFRKGIDK